MDAQDRSEDQPQTGLRTCRYKTEVPFKEDPSKKLRLYACQEPPLSGSEYCIFHDRRPDKDKEEFKNRLRQQLEGQGRNQSYNFEGYCFPEKWGTWEEVMAEKVFTDADFSQAVFQGDAGFSEARFQGYTSFSEATFQGEAVFDKAEFQGDSSFRGVTFQRGASFTKARFQEEVSFRGSTFKGDVFFRGTVFQEEVAFINVKFQRDADFIGATFQSLVDFHEARFASPRSAEVAFRKARRAWEEEGNRFKADSYFYREMVAKRRQKNRWCQWPLRSLEWLLVDLTCAYGVSYVRIILSTLVLILGSAFIVALAGEIDLTNSNAEFLSMPFIRRLLYTGYFSIITFTTLGYGDIYPVGKLTRIVASAEAFIGTFMMALFVVVFARKYMR